jgi:hypothetical protein
MARGVVAQGKAAVFGGNLNLAVLQFTVGYHHPVLGIVIKPVGFFRGTGGTKTGARALQAPV